MAHTTTRSTFTLGLLTAVAAGLVALAPGATTQAAGRSAPTGGVYTEAQAARGAALYAGNCVYCHLVDLSGGELAPALTGTAFVARWTNRPLAAVFDYMRVAMPLNSPGGLSDRQNADLLAFLLQRAGFPAGTTDLPADAAALKAVTPVRP